MTQIRSVGSEASTMRPQTAQISHQINASKQLSSPHSMNSISDRKKLLVLKIEQPTDYDSVSICCVVDLSRRPKTSSHVRLMRLQWRTSVRSVNIKTSNMYYHILATKVMCVFFFSIKYLKTFLVFMVEKRTCMPINYHVELYVFGCGHTQSYIRCGPDKRIVFMEHTHLERDDKI